MRFWLGFIASSIGLDVFIAGVRIVLVIGKSIAVFYEMLYVVDGYGKAESAVKNISHIRNTDDLARQIKQRAAGIARIDVGIGLDIDKPLKGPVCCADQAVGNGSLEAERIADSEDLLACFDAVDIAEVNEFDPGVAEVLDLQQCQVNKRIDGFDLDVFENLFFKAVLRLLEHGDFDFGFFFYYVIVGYQERIFIYEEA